MDHCQSLCSYVSVILGVATSARVTSLPSLPETVPVWALGNPSPECEKSQFLHCAIGQGKGAKAMWQLTKIAAESNTLFSFKWRGHKLSAFWLPFPPPLRLMLTTLIVSSQKGIVHCTR